MLDEHLDRDKLSERILRGVKIKMSEIRLKSKNLTPEVYMGCGFSDKTHLLR